MKRRFSPLALLVLAAALAGPALAQELSWRATSVQGPRLPGVNTRIGVALFAHGEGATYVRRVSAAGAPVDGRLDIDVESIYRFRDGATIVMRSRETIRLAPQGQHGQDAWTGQGEITAGSGRYEGIQGRFSFRAVTGIDAGADGVLGDSFLAGQARYSLPAAK